MPWLLVLAVPKSAPHSTALAVLAHSATTVKTLTHRGGTIVLEPANPSERAIEVGPRSDFAVLGVVCGVFRPFYEQEPAPTFVEESQPQQEPEPVT